MVVNTNNIPPQAWSPIVPVSLRSTLALLALSVTPLLAGEGPWGLGVGALTAPARSAEGTEVHLYGGGFLVEGSALTEFKGPFQVRGRLALVSFGAGGAADYLGHRMDAKAQGVTLGVDGMAYGGGAFGSCPYALVGISGSGFQYRFQDVSDPAALLRPATRKRGASFGVTYGVGWRFASGMELEVRYEDNYSVSTGRPAQGPWVAPVAGQESTAMSLAPSFFALVLRHRF